MKEHRSLACMLMASLPFISCFSDNAKLETAEKMPNSTETSIPPILEEQRFKSQEGHLVNFNRTKKGELKASVKLDYLRDPYVDLPVYIDQNLDQQEINVTPLKKWEKNRLIHVQLKGQQTPYIYIAHEGLMGGGKKKKKKKNNNTNNQREKENNKKKKEGDAQEPSEKLSFPKPTALSVVGKPHLSNHEVQSFLGKVQQCKETGYLQGIIDGFLALAKRGYGPIQHEAMYQLGLICEEQGQSELAVRWYVAAFEHSWWEDPQQAHQLLACQALKKLGYERIPLIYPSDITKEDISKPALQYEIYTSLIEFYQNGTAEPYLTQQENKKKIDILTIKAGGLILTKEVDQSLTLHSKELACIHDLVTEGNYTEAEVSLLTILEKLPYRNCLHNLASIYAKNDNEWHPDYEKAAEYFLKASTAQSFFSLGNLYYSGRIGKINGEIDYKTAAKYFELSGCPDALHNLSIIYKEGYIGQPDYQKAEEYLKKSDTGRAHYGLGLFYKEGYIGNNTPYSDDALAAHHLCKAIEKGYLGAYNALGVLCCLNKYGSKDNNQPNYELAVEYFQKAISSSCSDTHKEQDRHRKRALSNLGLVYASGYYGTKDGNLDYETAKTYLKESNRPEAFYNLGLLYEKGHLGTMDAVDGKQVINYQKALTYYKKSALPEAQLAILHLYQSGHITTNSLEEKQQAINKTIEDIDYLLPDLPTDKQLYIQGMIQYYIGNWKDALVTLKEAWMQGSQQTELPELIEELESYYVSEVEEEIEIQETTQETKISEPKSTQEKENRTEIEEEIEIQETTQETKISEPKSTQEKENRTEIEEEIEIQETTQETKISELKPAEEKESRTWKTLTKAQKKIIKTQRDREKFLDNFKDHPPAPQQPGGPVELEFINDRARKAFEAFREENDKIDDILGELQNDPWSTEGVGQPEVLRYSNGLMSRRITEENRLVYKPMGNKIRVFSWEGHYKNVKKF